MYKKRLLTAVACLVLAGCQNLSRSQIDPQQEPLDISAAELADAEENELVDANSDTTEFIDTVPLVNPDTTTEPVAAVQDKPTTPLPPADIWQRIRSGYQLQLDHDKPRLSSQIKWYSSHPSYLDRVSKRGQRYLYYIVEELEKAHIPLEIAFLPIVESGFDPFGYSHGRASGPWRWRRSATCG